MSGLYPEIQAYETGFLDRGDGVSLYFEQSGARDGEPVLYLHGGPGSGMGEEKRRYFDPERYRLIQLDQRGAGKSRPHAMLEGNTTEALIEDAEALRAHLGLERWSLFGVSWGSTLALAYAQAHPDRIAHMLISGVFLGEPEEIAFWYSEDGAPRFHPRGWADFIAPVPPRARGDWRSLVAWYLDAMREESESGRYDALPFDDRAALIEASRGSLLYAWTIYENVLANFARTSEQSRRLIAGLTPGYVKAHSLIEAWYFGQACFLAPGQLIAGMERIRHIPLEIIQGRLDMITPPRSAVRVAEAHGRAQIRYGVRHGHIMRGEMKGMIRRAYDRRARIS